MRNLVPDDELAEPFWLYASVDPDFKAKPKIGPLSQTFTTRSEAVKAFNSVPNRYRFKWLAEIGEYEERDGILVRDWIWYLWSRNEKYGEPAKDLGRGLPENDIDNFRTYKPLAPGAI